ncbi:MAG: Rid family detoxifying hydrolase [Candidatus Dormibacteria bacterium]
MTGTREIRTDRAPAPGGPYSQAVVAGDFVFVSGQRPVDPVSGSIPGGVEAQSAQVLKNLAAVLDAAGSSLAEAVKVTAHLADLGDFATFNKVYMRFFNPPYPARTTVGSELRGILVEVDVIAVRARG